jgi:hypothetical protein
MDKPFIIDYSQLIEGKMNQSSSGRFCKDSILKPCAGSSETGPSFDKCLLPARLRNGQLSLFYVSSRLPCPLFQLSSELQNLNNKNNIDRVQK